jgi:hypothetical protein
MIKKQIVTILFLFSLVFLVFGHGIKIGVNQQAPCIILKAEYRGGQAMAHADLTIRFENEETDYQAARTDKNGIFCFYPDRPGKWIVIADDGMGHRGKKEILLDKGFFSAPKSETQTLQAGDENKALNEAKELSETNETKEIKKEEKTEPVKKIPLSQNDMCCYLLKIVLGVILILGVTFILHRWKKKIEK